MTYMKYEIPMGDVVIAPPCIIRVDDAAVIPMDEGNIDYQDFLAWQSEGNQLLEFDGEVFNNGNN